MRYPWTVRFRSRYSLYVIAFFQSISLSSNICIPGWCYTTSRPTARECPSNTPRFFRRLTSSSCMSYLVSSGTSSDFHISSPLEVTSHPNLPQVGRTMPQDAHSLVAPRRYSNARHPVPELWTGSETISLAHSIDEMMKTLSCMRVAPS